ncbi:chemotaxis protein CheW [Azospirillum sp. TSO35-2]|uniref:chemotaxis protein CheW n=1 Tax=Azospirillum sp. TSO35-2 TaxID=716796 RepID=UPI000D61E1D5|nr:chemotaxis protein CheW [Azospirillum sp. TSO35-2]PWC33977.1 chemotaxis protein CheW [Azospirillum sp. TSO35-2]
MTASPAPSPALEGAAEGPTVADDRLAFLVVAVGGLRLALPLAAVRAVIRLPDLVRIPLGPSSLDGLAQWHGEAVPVLDLARALGQPGGAAAATREARVVLVGHRGQPIGLRVDAMAGLLRVAADRIDPVAKGESGGGDSGEGGGLDTALLDGVLRDGPATILKLDALIDRQFGALEAERTAGPARGFGGPSAAGLSAGLSAGQEAGRETVALLVFAVAGQEFALPVERVREVLPAPDAVARMAKAKAHLLGVMSVRDRLLPLVGLRALFGLDRGGDPAGIDRRVVVVRAGRDRAPVGVMVDEVREILRLDPARIDPVPPLLAREPEFEDLDGIARADSPGMGDGHRLLSVLSAERLFRHGAGLGHSGPGDAGAAEEGEAMEPSRSGDGVSAAERFVVFRLAGAEYGLPVAAVREVLRRPDTPTPLPNAPDFVTGVLTLRGEVLPLIDQRRLLHLPAAAGEADRGRVVVVGRDDATRVGLLVDGLSGLLAIPPERIGPAPSVSEAQRRLIRRVATLDQGDRGGASRLILLMDADSLLDMDRLTGLLAAAG